MTVPADLPPEPFGAELVPFPVENNLPGLPAPAQVRKLLGEQFTAAVTRERQARGPVRQESDVWPMVRAVEGFRDLVTSYSRALADVAKQAKQVLGEEMVEVHGDQAGIANGSLRVPTAGGVLTVKPATEPVHEFDRDQVMAALSAFVGAQWRAEPTMPDPASDPEQFGMAVACAALDMMGAAALKVTHVRALADRLGMAGEDSLAQVVRDAIRTKRRLKGDGVAVDYKAVAS